MAVRKSVFYTWLVDSLKKASEVCDESEIRFGDYLIYLKENINENKMLWEYNSWNKDIIDILVFDYFRRNMSVILQFWKKTIWTIVGAK